MSSCLLGAGGLGGGRLLLFFSVFFCVFGGGGLGGGRLFLVFPIEFSFGKFLIGGLVSVEFESFMASW